MRHHRAGDTGQRHAPIGVLRLDLAAHVAHHDVTVIDGRQVQTRRLRHLDIEVDGAVVPRTADRDLVVVLVDGQPGAAVLDALQAGGAIGSTRLASGVAVSPRRGRTRARALGSPRAAVSSRSPHAPRSSSSCCWSSSSRMRGSIKTSLPSYAVR